MMAFIYAIPWLFIATSGFFGVVRRVVLAQSEYYIALGEEKIVFIWEKGRRVDCIVNNFAS